MSFLMTTVRKTLFAVLVLQSSGIKSL